VSNKKMLILADGASIHTVRWVEGLSLTSDWDLYLISMNPAGFHPELDRLPQLRERYMCAPKSIYPTGNNFQYLFKLREIFRIRKQVQPDLINTVYLTSYGVVGALIKGNAKLCHFTIGTDIMITPDRNWFFRRLTQFALSRADFVFSVSQTLTQRLTAQFKVAKNRILTQSYGLADWVLQYAPRPKVFDFVSGRMWIQNSNIDFILTLLGRLPNKFQLALIGCTVSGQEDLGAKIMSEAKSLPGVKVMGVLPHSKFIEVTAESEFFFSLTAMDGAPSSLQEAMAVGAIPIVSDIPPNREWIKHGENGFLVPLNDSAAAAQVVAKALSTSDIRRNEMRELNRRIVQERGSFDKNMHRVLEWMDRPSKLPTSPVHEPSNLTF
jgi:glycosyltransferase involved in cell wall biosynthesis